MAINETTTAPNAGIAPAYGVTLIDEKPATSLRFEKREVDGAAKYTISFHMDGKQVARFKDMDGLDLVDAVGERNAARIGAADAAKGALKGENLSYEYGLSPGEAQRRIAAKEDWKRGDMEGMTSADQARNMAAGEIDEHIRDADAPRYSVFDRHTGPIVDTADAGEALKAFREAPDSRNVFDHTADKYVADQAGVNPEFEATAARQPGLGPEYAEGMAARHPLVKDMTAGAEIEVNSIAHTPELEQVNVKEALETAAKLRQKDREAVERETDGRRFQMQDRAEGEQHRVKLLDQEARRLNTANGIDQEAGRDTQPERQLLTEAEKNRRIQLMEQVNAQFRNAAPRYYFKDQPTRIAFRDAGDTLKTASNDPRVAKAMVMMAASKGWKTITPNGNPEFQREIWFEASIQGMGVKSYKPTQQDLAALAAYQERQMGNSIERGPERVRAAGREPGQDAGMEPTPVTAENGARRLAAAAALGVAVPEPAKATDGARSAPVAALDANEGIIVNHGRAPFNNDPQEKQSYFVTLATASGEKTVWGKDLERALAENGASKGDAVRLEFKGSERVKVEALKRDDKGKVIGSEPIETNRNTWEVHRSDEAKVVAAVASALVADKVKNPASRQAVMKAMDSQIRAREQAGTLPKVMVFDKAAPAKNPDAERTGPVVERNAERTR